MEIYFYKNKETGEFKMQIKPVEDENWVELKANSTDAAVEKHVPVIEREGNKVVVTVGSTLHPMSEEHFISHIILVTDKQCIMRNLKPGDEPKASFDLEEGEEIKEAYSYCNLHSLWVKKR